MAGVMVALLFSPPVTVAFELTLYALMLGSAQLRARLWAAARQPLPAMALAFWLLMALAMLYSIAPWREAFGVWWSWRRLVLLALAAFAAALMLREPALSPAGRVLLILIALLLCSNVILVTTARSGYAALIVLTVILAYQWPRSASHLQRLAWTAAGAAAIAGALALSPIVQQRVAKGLHELAHYDRNPGLSPIGDRVIFLRNSLELATERPLFGYGTGAFREAYAKKVGREALQTKDPHNAYLFVAVQYGLAGLAVFLALLAVALRQPARAPFRLLALSALAAWCVTSLFNGHFYTFAEGRFIWLWLGACLAREAPA